MITCVGNSRKIIHSTSTDQRNVETPKGTHLVEQLAYIEKYINENGFAIKSVVIESGMMYYLIEKEA